MLAAGKGEVAGDGVGAAVFDELSCGVVGQVPSVVRDYVDPQDACVGDGEGMKGVRQIVLYYAQLGHASWLGRVQRPFLDARRAGLRAALKAAKCRVTKPVPGEPSEPITVPKWGPVVCLRA